MMHPVAQFVLHAERMPEDFDGPSWSGAWLKFTILGGNNFLASRVISGIAWWDENFELIGIQRDLWDTGRRQVKWADNPTWLNPEHVVTVTYAASGADGDD